MIERLRLWLNARLLRALTRGTDYSIRPGDLVVRRGDNHPEPWRFVVLDVNWAMRAVAIRYENSKNDAACQVLPSWSIKKV